MIVLCVSSGNKGDVSFGTEANVLYSEAERQQVVVDDQAEMTG